MDEQALIGSSIFLEMILNQERVKLCIEVIQQRQDALFISDFALHSIGVALMRSKRNALLLKFLNDLAPRLRVMVLPVSEFAEILKLNHQFNLDYDDSYQIATANYYGLSFLTLDSDFAKLKSDKVHILR